MKRIRKMEIIPFQVGDKVSLKTNVIISHDPDPPTFAGRRVKATKIEALLPEGKEMVALLEVRLGGYWAWNVDELHKET